MASPLVVSLIKAPVSITRLQIISPHSKTKQDSHPIPPRTLSIKALAANPVVIRASPEHLQGILVDPDLDQVIRIRARIPVSQTLLILVSRIPETTANQEAQLIRPQGELANQEALLIRLEDPANREAHLI
jgi:hypothetical protein